LLFKFWLLLPPHVHAPSIFVQLFDFLLGFQGKRLQLVSGSSLLLVGFVSPCWHLGIVGFCFCFCFFSSFGGSNSCSDSCEGGKFMGGHRKRKKMGFVGKK